MCDLATQWTQRPPDSAGVRIWEALVVGMLRTEVTGTKLWLLWGACAVVGSLAAALVALGNPGNMGICGACFLRDTAGA